MEFRLILQLFPFQSGQPAPFALSLSETTVDYLTRRSVVACTCMYVCMYVCMYACASVRSKVQIKGKKEKKKEE